MPQNTLLERVEKKEARIAVIGLGYVGFPVACRFAQVGFHVTGVDILKERIDTINDGNSPIKGHEPGLQELVTEVVASGRLKATTQYSDLTDCDVILIDVETPVDDQNQPQYHALRSCLNSLGPVLKEGSLVIVESTISPGTMQNLVLPLLEESSVRRVNEGFYLGNCPERVMPGRLLQNLEGMSRVVGGMTPETAATMVALYRQIVAAELDATDCITAELVKTVENAYRDVQIAFANEVALVCEAVGGDVWKVRELVNKSPGRNMLLPGAGVGGHCIPKDPWLLAYSASELGNQLRLIPAARAVNDGMPNHVLSLLEAALQENGTAINGSKVLIMGYAYLEDSDDTRNSPSEALVELLEARGATSVIHDPFVDEYKGDLLERAKGCDAAILMVKHAEYAEVNLQTIGSLLSKGIFIDSRGFLDSSFAKQAGLNYYRLGVAQ